MKLGRVVVLVFGVAAALVCGATEKRSRGDVIATAADYNATTRFLSRPSCYSVPAHKLVCEYSCQCTYGVTQNITCTSTIPCVGPQTFMRTWDCLHCWQAPEYLHSCTGKRNCASGRSDMYITNCTVPNDFLCLGSRIFQKWVPCNWASGNTWVTTVFLSAMLGGFGADRFYIGYAGWGVFKMLSLGGLGVWAVVDFIMEVLGYLTPANGSVYSDLGPVVPPVGARYQTQQCPAIIPSVKGAH
ncbi:TM2 domain [Pelomyxa schiedti]|nr:TM2 domain [Pelomyxa schiedti]